MMIIITIIMFIMLESYLGVLILDFDVYCVYGVSGHLQTISKLKLFASPAVKSRTKNQLFQTLAFEAELWLYK